jgi:acetoin utilization protein AcuC
LSDRVALVRVDEIARLYDFGSSHPLRPERVLGTYDNISELGLTARANVFEVGSRAAEDSEITAVHDKRYVDVVQGIDSGALSESDGLPYGLGTPDDPIFPQMHVASAAVCGASITGAELLASGEADHAFNPAGGLHHARRAEASGFCIYNDPAAAIAKLLTEHPDWRVLYLDVDVHHGDGVQWIFYDDPRVATISFHQSGHYLYPGTGFEDEVGTGDALGTAINVPLLPYTGGADYLWALGEVLPSVASAFKPDAIVTQLGGDTHHGDPLANLGLTMSDYPKMAALIHSTVHEHCQGRWLGTGGGGYQFEEIVPRIWTIHFAEMCGVPEAIPKPWLDDLEPSEVSRPYRERVEASVARVLGECLPRLTQLADAPG